MVSPTQKVLAEHIEFVPESVIIISYKAGEIRSSWHVASGSTTEALGLLAQCQRAIFKSMDQQETEHAAAEEMVNRVKQQNNDIKPN